MPRLGRLHVVLAAVVIALLLTLVVARCGRDPEGLAGLPPLGDLASIPDQQLLMRVQTELSRRSGGDRACLSQDLRSLWTIEAGEIQLIHGGLLDAALFDLSGAPHTHRPSLGELAEAYRWLGLAGAADALEEAQAIAEREREPLLRASAEDRRGQAGLFAASEKRLRAALATSRAARQSWLRAHPEALAEP